MEDLVQHFVELIRQAATDLPADVESALRAAREREEAESPAQGALDAIIEKFLVNWTMERITTSDKEVLRIGIYQLLFRPEQDPSIVIDRAVRIAKKYGDKDSGKFVNGLLGAIYRKHLQEQNNPILDT